MPLPEKFCIHCAHYRHYDDASIISKKAGNCDVQVLDPVTGRYGEAIAIMSRLSPYLCGNDAKFYELKVST